MAELNNPMETDSLRGGEIQKDKSRQSFKQKLQQIPQDNPPTSNPKGFLAATCGLLCCALPAAGCGLFLIFIVFALTNCVSIATIVIGALYKDEEYCPVEKISLLLIVGGSIALVESLLETISKCIINVRQKDGDQAPSGPACLNILMSLLRLASLCWFIAACVKIYGVKSIVSDDVSSENYCHPVLYLYAFWFVTVTLAILCFVFGIVIIVGCCACCLACLAGK